MEEKFNNKYRTTSARLSGWDYGSNGLYFVTICTKDRVRYFGEIGGKSDMGETDNHLSLRGTIIGNLTRNYWLQIPEHFPFVEIDEFVIMPDHMHGILFINKQHDNNWQLNKFGSQSRNLASIIRGYKASVKRYANLNGVEFHWQTGYYDRIIRNEKELFNIRQYIYDNPERWVMNDNIHDEKFLST